MIVAPYTFQCKELLFVLGQMHPPPALSEEGSIRLAAGQLANTLARNVIVVDEHELLVMLDDPVEAVSIAREHELRLGRCIASPLALELLHEAGDPARQAWAWLQQQLGVRANTSAGIVSIKGLPHNYLPAGVDQIPDRAGVLLWLVDIDTSVFVERATTLGTDAEIVVGNHMPTARIHAAVIPYNGTWAIQDRLSASGTFVDGWRCKSRCLIPGMTITLGAARVVVLSVR